MKPKLLLVKPPEDRAAIVDEFGRLDGSIPWDDVRKHSALREKISAWYGESDAAGAFTADGLGYRAVIGARGFQRTIRSMTKVKARLGLNTFLKHCSFTLKALEGLLCGDDVEQLTQTAQTGPRKVSVVQLQRQLAA